MEDKVATIDINDPFSLMDIRRKCPYKDVEDAKADLRRCFLATDGTPEVFMFKDYDAIREIVKVSYTSEQVARTKLKKIVIQTNIVDYKPKKLTAWDVYLENTLYYTVKGIAFYSKDPDVFSYFRGYDYTQLETVKTELIQPWLIHVHDVIADGNEAVYKYILVWIASILQHPNFKTETALVIISRQGSGKNAFFTDIICKLMARYANENITSIDSIVGKFNAALENKKLLICNEMQSIDMNKYLNADALKSVITDRIININQKNEPMRTVENVANLILVSNNDVPIKIDADDRRYVVVHPNEKHCKDFTYFDKLHDSFTPEFYENLFTFFMTYNTSGFNLRNIPETEAKEDIKEASKSSYELFVEDSFESIEDVSGPTLYNMYVAYCEHYNYSVASHRTFIANIKRFTGQPTVRRVYGENTKVYNVLPELRSKLEAKKHELESAILD